MDERNEKRRTENGKSRTVLCPILGGRQGFPQNCRQFPGLREQFIDTRRLYQLGPLNNFQPKTGFSDFFPSNGQFVDKIGQALSSACFFIISSCRGPATKQLAPHMPSNLVLWQGQYQLYHSNCKIFKPGGNVLAFHQYPFFVVHFPFSVLRSSFLIFHFPFSLAHFPMILAKLRGSCTIGIWSMKLISPI